MASDLQRYGGAGDWSCCALVLVDESAEDLAALVGAGNPDTSRDLGVFVDQASDLRKVRTGTCSDLG